MTDRQTTHAPGCWDWGPRHYECAVREIGALRAEVERLVEALRRYGVHDQACTAWDIPICTCGLDAALEQENSAMTDRYEEIRKALAKGPTPAHLIAACNPDTIRELLEERDALARENEALKRCAIKYLGWLGVTHIPLDQALHSDMRNPSVCGDAALSKENSNG